MRIYRMKVMNDFVCLNGHHTELLVDSKATEVPCPHCTEVAYKVLAAPRVKLEGITGSFPGAYDKWERQHKQALKVAESKSYYEG